MTTEELAQLIEDAHPRGFVKDAADLLRQLQAELDDCKAQLVLQKNDLFEILCALDKANLTDEEIESAWFKVFKPEAGIGKNITNGAYEFARAILKKASGE